jgi:lysyl-tRNA synthetase class II
MPSSWTLTAKSLRPLPEKFRGLTDPGSRVRQRYVDLIVSPEARRSAELRAAVMHSIRSQLNQSGFLEVETPVLTPLHGGANARPFVTHVKPVAPGWNRGQIVLEIYERLVEKPTMQPTFYRDFPVEVSPLVRQHRTDPRLAERWDLVVSGAELGTGYSKLADAVVQRARLTAQSLLRAGGDPEAIELDEDFPRALEYGMPPTGGMGMGVDRLLMTLTGQNIRETLLFPFVRPE